MYFASDVYLLSEHPVLTYSVVFEHWNDSLNGGSATVWDCSHYKRISLFLELTRNSALK
jgi:hypothetical protein